MRAALSIFLGVLLALAVGACSRRGRGFLELETFLQQGRPHVRLNERIVLRFSRPLDRTTLCGDAAVIRGAAGPARGAWRVRGRELCFRPRLPLHPDGSDAGLRPGTTYTLVLRGFPDYRALRAVTGEYLRRTLCISFHTAGRSDGGTPPPLELFVDPVPGRGPEVTAVEGRPIVEVGTDGVRIAQGAPLHLVFSEPIFPGSLVPKGGKIYVLNAEGTVDPVLDALPLEAHLLPVPPEGCVVALAPEGGFRGGRRYKLYLEDLGLTDFGGRPVEKTRGYLDITCEKPSSP